MKLFIPCAVLLSLAGILAARADNFTSASCLAQNKVGFAQCDAVCPPGYEVLNCTSSAGNLSTGDTCTTLARTFAGGVDASGQPNPQPHDRCSVAAACGDGSKSLSVQGWATCFKP